MSNASSRPGFISLRWRLTLPVLLLVLVVAMLAAYAVGRSFNNAVESSQSNWLLQTSQVANQSVAEQYEQSRLEAQRIAFTRGVSDAVRSRDAQTLQPILEGLASLVELDSVIIVDTQGLELIGLLRISQSQSQPSYALSTGTDLRQESVVRAVFDEAYVGAAGLARTPQGMLLYTAVPVYDGETLLGAVIVGRSMNNLLTRLQTATRSDYALYGDEGALLQSTLVDDASPQGLTLTPEMFRAALSAQDTVQIASRSFAGAVYQAAYSPFIYGPSRLGVLAVFLPDNTALIQQTGRQIAGLSLAAIAAFVIIGLFLITNRSVIAQSRRVAAVASALTTGDLSARTRMLPTDEIRAVGHALDRYADHVQQRHDALHVTLRRQRREAEFLLSVLESIPDGVIVQDQDGQIIVMNEQARSLLGSQNIQAGLRDLNTVVANRLGKAIAPGLYSLGDPLRLQQEDKILSAQAAAMLNMFDQRVGTVVILRDITREVHYEQMQDKLLQRLSDDVQSPLLTLSRAAASDASVTDIARGLSRHAAALQKLIVEMREITLPQLIDTAEVHKPLYLDTLIWVIANEWGQVASAASLTLEVVIEKHNLYILGDERRLRWAIGNIIDNAIKYTSPGGKLTLEINGESGGRALLRVRDNGLAIAPEELPHIFTRYYRGTPRLADGQVWHVPGTGQGLFVARQIIESHGGLIQIKSRLGVGTAVYFALPLTASVSYEIPYLASDVDLEGETVRLSKSR